MQPGQIGAPQLHLEIVEWRRVVQVDRSEEVEVEVAVARGDPSVELLVADFAVEAERVVVVAVEFELRDASRHIGVGRAAAHRAVELHGESRASQQRAASQQFPEFERRRADLALQMARLPVLRLKPQRAGGVARLRVQLCAGFERLQQAFVPSAQPHRSRAVEHRQQTRREPLAGDGAGQHVDVGGRRGELCDRQIEMRRGDVGQSADREVGFQNGAVAYAQVVAPSREVGHRPFGPEFRVSEGEVPVAQARGEIGDVVGRDRRAADVAVDPDLADEILVVGPRIADQRDGGDADVRPGGFDVRVLESEAAVDEVEPAREVVQHETAAFACREGGHRHVDGGTVDGEVVDQRLQPVEVHVGEIDAVGPGALLPPVDAEIQAVETGRTDRQDEIFFLFLLFRQPVDDLFDVHLARRGFAQVEFAAGDLGATQRQAASGRSPRGDERLGPPGVEQRIALVILHVETVYLYFAEKSDLHPVDADGGLQLPRDHPCRLVHDEVLHGRNVEQQREQQGQDYQQQHGCGQHLSQYFYTFAQKTNI